MVARGAPMVVGAVVALAGAAGCDRPAPGANPGAAPAFAVRDSGGVEIVENHAPEWPEGRFWTIDTVPAIVVGGGREDTEAAQLVWEVVGIARLEDGRVAVLSQGNHGLYLFEPSGELSRTIGRRGDGPGEFTRAQKLQYLAPDTLVVWDYWFSAASYFDAAGRLLRERSFDIQAMRDRVPGFDSEVRFHPLPDGSLVVLARGDPPVDEPRPGSLARLPADHYVRVDDAGAAHSLGWWDGWEEWFPPVRWDWGGFPTLLLDTYMAAGGNPPSIYLTKGEADEIHQFALDGTLVRIIRRTAAPGPVTEAAHQAWKDYASTQSPLVESAPPPGTTWPEFFHDIPRTETHPPIAGLIVDTEGYLWVREWSPEAEARIPDQWSVFGPDGRWLGVVRGVPDYFACRSWWIPCWVDRDFLLTIRIDDDLVERVEGYRIRRAVNAMGVPDGNRP